MKEYFWKLSRYSEMRFEMSVFVGVVGGCCWLERLGERVAREGGGVERGGWG